MYGKYYREFKLGNITIYFDSTSRILFHDENDDEILSLDPSGIKILYNAYRGMEREIAEDETKSIHIQKSK